MKRQIFIIGGIIIVVALLLVWVYLLFFGTPKDGENGFTNFNFGDTTDPNVSIDTAPELNNDVVVDTTSKERLRQLTTKPTLAFTEVQFSTTTPRYVRYIEAGTGHIFEINYETGEEKRISATTIPVARKAAISPNGSYVMVQSKSGIGAEFTIGVLSTTSEKILTRSINENVIDFEINNNYEAFYAVQQNSSLVAKSYNFENDTSSTLFTIPFREATISWGNSGNSTHYFYPKSAAVLESPVFKVSNGKISRTPVDGYGLSAIGNSEYILSGEVISNGVTIDYTSNFYSHNNKKIIGAILNIIPDKCVASTLFKAEFYCAHPSKQFEAHLMPDKWYAGDISFSDSFWSINAEFKAGGFLVDTFTATNREIDGIKLRLNTDETNLYFLNKNDSYLWIYELSVDD